MEEIKAKSERTMQQINDDYYRACLELGDKTYKITRMQDDVKAVHKRILELDLEAKMLEEKTKADKAAAEPAIAEVANA